LPAVEEEGFNIEEASYLQGADGTTRDAFPEKLLDDILK